MSSARYKLREESSEVKGWRGGKFGCFGGTAVDFGLVWMIFSRVN